MVKRCAPARYVRQTSGRISDYVCPCMSVLSSSWLCRPVVAHRRGSVGLSALLSSWLCGPVVAITVVALWACCCSSSWLCRSVGVINVVALWACRRYHRRGCPSLSLLIAAALRVHWCSTYLPLSASVIRVCCFSKINKLLCCCS